MAPSKTLLTGPQGLATKDLLDVREFQRSVISIKSGISAFAVIRYGGDCESADQLEMRKCGVRAPR